MARMIPADIFSGCPSAGEREVFARLKNSAHTEGWIVLHSLDLARHVRNTSGEADFVVIIPGLGVLCLEVKACKRLRHTDVGWYYGTDPTADPRGPFRQAAEAMHSIRVDIQRRCPRLAKIVFWSAVVFPYVEFAEKSVEWHPWQFIDQRLLRIRPLSLLLCQIMSRARDLLSVIPSAKWFSPLSTSPSIAEAEEIASLLRPNFEVFESPAGRRGRWSEEVRHYTEEQFAALDAMDDNPRVLFSGPAGTGKTLLAIEAAQRSQALGRRTLLVCFNRLLGLWLENQIGHNQSRLTVGTFHSQLVAAVGGVTGNDQDRPDFWNKELPNRAIDAVLQKEKCEVFDEVIMDEAQDLLRPPFLDFLDLLLVGGLSSGRWRFFGDFENQNLYGPGDKRGEIVLSERVGELFAFSLRTNCRNSPRIASLTCLLGGLTPNYKRILRPDNGIEPEILYYSEREEQEALLCGVLEKLRAQGVDGQEIVILSPRTDSSSLAAQIRKEPWRSRLSPFSQKSGGRIGYGSVHSFKGLEAPVVIVTDIEHVKGDVARDLFYVAVTRALHKLTILASQNGRDEIVSLLRGKPAVQP